MAVHVVQTCLLALKFMAILKSLAGSKEISFDANFTFNSQKKEQVTSTQTQMIATQQEQIEAPQQNQIVSSQQTESLTTEQKNIDINFTVLI